MKFFIDSANLEELKDAVSYGIIDGVTTNPSLVSKEGSQTNFKDLVKEICKLVQGPVSAEVLSTEFKKMVKEARDLANIHKHIVVKLPLTEDGIRATKVVSDEGIKVNVTLVFSPSQAILAAKAGAAYVSPFVGRLDDISTSGMDLIYDISEIYNNYGFDTEILVASIRHPQHIVESAKMGADVATIPYKVFKQLFKHPLSDIGLERFLKDWGK
ncbi:MAG: fructose-6-phosphate aldolase [Candidatus Dadabacteria bacterium]|nr:fructose-6-phosphate aldolase [Candidatus Dadabacteria bacterium]NIQ16035.1 fructose-6-phosphate aldolase [Candidatus Dadabacteria bacterium]